METLCKEEVNNIKQENDLKLSGDIVAQRRSY
jgi:hypothetical protein